MTARVIHGDCFEMLPKLDGVRFQTAFVDPPYNIGVDYGSGAGADLLSDDEYLRRMRRLMVECHWLLKPSGSLWWLCPERWADRMGLMLSELMPRRNRIIWRETFGQYREDRFPGGHRHLFWHVTDEKASPFLTADIRVVSQRMLDGDKRAKGPRVPDDVWDIPRLVGNAGERVEGHPCQLPETLLERIILCSTSPADLVLDPMAGTGTTLRVAQRLDRQYIGIEEQSAFADLITQRLQQDVQPLLF